MSDGLPFFCLFVFELGNDGLSYLSLCDFFLELGNDDSII